MTVKHFVEFMYVGTFFSDSSVEEVESRNPDAVKADERAYAFRFFDQTHVEQGGEALKGEIKNRSGFYYLRGDLETIDQVRKRDPDSILYHNMRCNGWDMIINVDGRSFPFGEADDLASK